MVFDKDLYPLYENKKVQTQSGSFPVHDAKVYVFRRRSDGEDIDNGQVSHNPEEI